MHKLHYKKYITQLKASPSEIYTESYWGKRPLAKQMTFKRHSNDILSIVETKQNGQLNISLVIDPFPHLRLQTLTELLLNTKWFVQSDYTSCLTQVSFIGVLSHISLRQLSNPH